MGILLLLPVAFARCLSIWKSLTLLWIWAGFVLSSNSLKEDFILKAFLWLLSRVVFAVCSTLHFLYGHWPITVNRCASLEYSEIRAVLLPEKLLLFQCSKRNLEHLDPSKEHLSLCFALLPAFSSFHIMSLMKLERVGGKAIAAVYQVLRIVQRPCQSWEVQVLFCFVNWLCS